MSKKKYLGNPKVREAAINEVNERLAAGELGDGKLHIYNNGEMQVKTLLCPTGFVKGRLPVSEETKLKQSNSAKKRGSNNKGKKLSKQACKNMSIAKRNFLNENPSWESPTQFKPGQTPWNKGLTKEDDTRLAKMAESYTLARPKGYHYDEETKLQKWEKEQITRIQNSGSLEQSYADSRVVASETRSKHKLEDPEFNKKIKLKTDATKIKEYGSLENYYKISLSNREKTAIEKYGSLEEYYKYICKKVLLSKRKNGTLGGPSKAENLFYNRLLDFFSVDDIVRQYSEDRYPYLCDFYIKSLDLFIELNLYWTHGPHQFNPLSEEDLNLLEYIRSRQGYYINNKGYKVRNQFFNAEEVWTISDPLKIETAHENKLNYITLYNKEEIDDFFRRIQNDSIERGSCL